MLFSCGCSGALAVEKRGAVSAGGGRGDRHPSWQQGSTVAALPTPDKQLLFQGPEQNAAPRSSCQLHAGQTLHTSFRSPGSEGTAGTPWDSHGHPAVPGDSARTVAELGQQILPSSPGTASLLIQMHQCRFPPSPPFPRSAFPAWWVFPPLTRLFPSLQIPTQRHS